MPHPIPQVSFGGGVMSPATYARIDLQKFGSGLKRGVNYFVEAEGALSNRMGLQYVKEVKDSANTTRMIEFEFNEEEAYGLEFGNLYMRVHTDGGTLLESAQNITAATQANPVVVTVASHGYSNGDEVFIKDVVGMTELNGKYYTVANQTTNTFELSGVDGTAFTAYTSGGTAARVYEIATPYTSAQLAKLKFRQSNDVVYFGHRSHEPRKLTRSGATSWSLDIITFEPTQAAPTSVSITPQGASGSTTYNYYITAVAEETAEESVVASGTTATGNATLSTTNFNRATWTAAANAESYNVYREDNGLYGYVGSTETTTFDDKGLDPDLEDTAPKLRQPFNASGDYPEAVGLHEQRSWWGNTDNNPLSVYSSQTGQFENTNVSSPVKATDAITLRLVSGRGNEVRHFRSFREKLFAFTSGAVWTIEPGGDSDAITHDSKKVKVQEYLASTQVPPLTIKTNILMVAGKEDQGFEVHSIGEDVNSGFAGNYVGSDLTVLSRHLFETYSIKEWCYIERPFRLILAVRDDGKLLVMTYLNEHQIFAWTTWETDGDFESVCHVPEGQEDTAYFVVKRSVNGSDVRYIERLHSRTFTSIADAFFVDSGLSYDGTDAKTITGATQANPVVITSTAHGYSNGDTVRISSVVGMTEINDRDFTVANVTANTFELTGEDGTSHTAYTSGGESQVLITTLSGLDHLEGKTLIANADGNIENSLTVSNGSVTLASGFVKCHVGLSYEGLGESLPLNAAVQTVSKRKNTKNVVFRLKDTRGFYAGTNESNLTEYPARSDELWGDPANPLSDLIRVPVSSNWDRDNTIIFKSEPGLPQTILSMIPDTNHANV